jgi:hypothetical protein
VTQIPTSRKPAHAHRDLGITLQIPKRDIKGSGHPDPTRVCRDQANRDLGSDACPCHGEPWAVHGGQRTCAVKEREAHRRWKEANRERYLALKRENRQRRKARDSDVG